jgi:enediyne biosynthesis protein E4
MSTPDTVTKLPAKPQWWRDVRAPFAGLLALYVLVGLGSLGFDRRPAQLLLILGTSLVTDALFNRWYRGRAWAFPWSGLISGLGLCLLLNVGTSPWLAILPAFVGIAAKQLVTFKGRHVYNPSMVGVVVGVILGGGMVSPAPAYQWGGSLAMTLFVITAALMIFAFNIQRGPLILGFLGCYTLQMLLRAYILRHHLPVEVIILGTFTSAPFFLFTFYMLTDPMTSPKRPRDQLLLAGGVTLVDLYFHTRQTYSTLFISLFIVQTVIWAWRHLGEAYRLGLVDWWRERQAGRWLLLRALPLGGALAAFALLARQPHSSVTPSFALQPVPSAQSGLVSQFGHTLEEVDPRVQHIAKWVLSIGDAVAVADVDGDGLQDLFLTQPLKRPEDRCALYVNRGELRFERLPLPALTDLTHDAAKSGLPSAAVFADYDNDGDSDLLLGVSFGHCRLLRNELRETGKVAFTDVTETAGLTAHSTCLAAVWADFDGDGRLDLLVANSMSTQLPDYSPPRPLNLFQLPEPEYEGDRRPFHFMHASWHKAENGGRNQLYRNLGDGRFEALDMAAAGMNETHWTLAVSAADLNHDGLVDLYCASDFGPDDLYINDGGMKFHRLSGVLFGEIGRDTYKGMNCSIFDADGNGWLDVYVSNVHHPLQAEGSLLWMIQPAATADRGIAVTNEAAARGALNEKRFGWGAAAGDLDNDGRPDLVQANGMVDDSMDRRFATPHDYWYVNEKLARTGPEVHAYADSWGDIRGYSIWGHEANRVLLNTGGYFTDVATQLGLGAPGNSRAVALADFDNDGRLEVLITHQFSEVELWRNQPLPDAPATHWLGVRLRGVKTVAADAWNARVTLTPEQPQARPQYQEVLNVAGFSSQDEARLHFGLGSWAGTVALHILWPDGVVQDLKGLTTDRYLEIAYPAAPETVGGQP